uniref:CX domain-containing protein n=1 Tax=Romanomermis culicivorax TaxID=13658 RepID=A0A915HXR5_ROMCU
MNGGIFFDERKLRTSTDFPLPMSHDLAKTPGEVWLTRSNDEIIESARKNNRIVTFRQPRTVDHPVQSIMCNGRPPGTAGQLVRSASLYSRLDGTVGHPVHSKAKYVKSGKINLQYNKQKSSISTSNSDDQESDTIHWSLFIETHKSMIPSDKFYDFLSRAESAQLATEEGSFSRLYYFRRDGSPADKIYTNNGDTCGIMIETTDLIPFREYYRKLPESIPAYFLCREYCCGYECCELNQVLVGCSLFAVVILFSSLIYVYFRFFYHHFPCLKRPQELAVLRAHSTRYKNDTDQSVITTKMVADVVRKMEEKEKERKIRESAKMALLFKYHLYDFHYK